MVRQFRPAMPATIAGRKKATLDEVPTELLRPAWRRLVAAPGGQLNCRASTAMLERLGAALRTRDVFMAAASGWCDPRAKLLAASAWDAARPQVCRTLGLPAERTIARALRPRR